ncbi:GNAT family N-acetyltransferase, partial [Mesorhizobium sp. M2D.F.Ca.ET.145.01.1.1]
MLFCLSTKELMERPDLWEAVHRLRYQIFVEEMGWEDLRRPDGFEVDQFDHDEAVHQIVIRGNEVAGYQ